MIRIVVFVLVSVLFALLSGKSLFRPLSHGFYRFFAWEFILALILLAIPVWFKNPFSAPQIVSWLLLLVSLFLVLHGFYLLRIIGKPDQNRPGADLLAFERTSALVTAGAYKYIRHPLYSSLLFLAWGVFFKDFSWVGLLLAAAASLFLFLTAKRDESECLTHFGDAYRSYMQSTKRFIPFLF